MATVDLQIWTGAYPDITNNIQINIYDPEDPLAIVTSLNKAAPHLDGRTWDFPGLNRQNWIFRIFEMSGVTVVRQLGGDKTVVPSSAGGVKQKSSIQITADITTGFTSGVNTFTFDGTSGTEDWRGWDLDTVFRMATGPMKKGVDYSWNPTTGTFTLLIVGDLFGPREWLNVQFALQIGTGTDSAPTQVQFFTKPKKVTADYSINAGIDFGGNLILDPAGDYLEITFPDIVTVPEGKMITIEMRRAAGIKCGKFIFQAGQTLDWLEGARPDLYICTNESISIYRWIDPAGPTNYWRVFNPHGNWLNVGDQITNDQVAANVFNKVMLDGTSVDNKKFARFYNDHVLKLPGGQVVNYDGIGGWGTGNNKYFFSLANSTDMANAGKFFLADRRDVFERNTDGVRIPGNFKADQLKDHAHNTQRGDSYSGSSQEAANRMGGGQGTHPQTDVLSSGAVAVGTGDAIPIGNETYPKNIAVRKWIYV